MVKKFSEKWIVISYLNKFTYTFDIMCFLILVLNLHIYNI